MGSLFSLLLCFPLDIDECVTGKNLCPYNRQCVNTFGSYYCKCQEGYDLKYVNGKYDCVGKVYMIIKGSHLLTSSPRGTNRLLPIPDLDECAAGTYKCSHHAVCVNTQGSYRCRCKSGFRGNGFECSGEIRDSLQRITNKIILAKPFISTEICQIKTFTLDLKNRRR